MRPVHAPVLSRRVVLTLPLGAAALALGACGPSVPAPAPTTAGGSGGDAAASARMPHGTEEVEVALGPLVRVEVAGQEGSVLPMRVTRAAGAAGELTPGAVLIGGFVETLGSYKPLRLVDTTGLRVWTTTSTQSQFDALAPGASQDLTATFGAVDTDNVVVFLSGTGLVEVPVVDADDPSAPDLDMSAVALAAPDQNLAAPVDLERYIESVDGSSSAITDGDSTVVDLASDVTFDVDSAELTADAETALSGLAEYLGRFTSGSLTVTGHTDDVADDAYNQSLSEQRAQAVVDRLTALTDLAAWTLTVSGKGESEPKVPNTDDASRAVNRRVEVVVAPAQGTGEELVRSDGDATLPEAAGAVGAATQPLKVTGPQGFGSLTIEVTRMERSGALLLGELLITGSTGGSVLPLGTGWLDDPDAALANARGETGGLEGVLAADGLTLLVGADRLFPADYVLSGASAHRPLTELNLHEPLGEGERVKVCVVWPAVEEDTVVVDHPSAHLLSAPWRITGVTVS